MQICLWPCLFPLPSASFTCCPLRHGNQHSPTVLLTLWMNRHRSCPLGKRGNRSNQHRLTLGNSLINFLWTTLILAITGDVNKRRGGTFCTLKVITTWKQNLILSPCPFDSAREKAGTSITAPTCVCAKSLQLCLTCHGPKDCSSPGSSVHGILQLPQYIPFICWPLSSLHFFCFLSIHNWELTSGLK